jgi:hypothetical protein
MQGHGAVNCVRVELRTKGDRQGLRVEGRAALDTGPTMASTVVEGLGHCQFVLGIRQRRTHTARG